IRIKNLRLRTIIGVKHWERRKVQDVIINVEIEFDGSKVAESDNIHDTINDKAVKNRIVEEVEKSRFYLLDRLASHVLKIVMEDKKVQRATVEVDKPNALRFADSVSVSCSAER
ncbi:MAG: dihydroneopterin triphosphate 2'-epimerase, partial [Candidatus Neomarinimicrobiota bacterium]